MSANLAHVDFLYDNRIADRNVREGRLKKDEYLSFLSTLPDLAEQCEDISDVVFDLEHSKVALSGDYINADEDNE